MIKKYVISFTFIFVINCINAQKNSTGNWFIYFGNQAISKKINWWNEVQYRNYNIIGDLQQLLLRTGVGINLSENNNNLLLGYAFIKSEKYLSNNEDKVVSQEHRIYQQFLTKQHFGRFSLQHRYRIEERFLPVNKFNLRVRYFIAANMALNQKNFNPKTIYLSAYNEIFLNNDHPTFDRNRLYGALGYVINKSLKMEFGLMSQSTDNEQRNQFQIVFFNNIALHKN